MSILKIILALAFVVAVIGFVFWITGAAKD